LLTLACSLLFTSFMAVKVKGTIHGISVAAMEYSASGHPASCAELASLPNSGVRYSCTARHTQDNEERSASGGMVDAPILYAACHCFARR